MSHFFEKFFQNFSGVGQQASGIGLGSIAYYAQY
jgi:hypothetical protein